MRRTKTNEDGTRDGRGKLAALAVATVGLLSGGWLTVTHARVASAQADESGESADDSVGTEDTPEEPADGIEGGAVDDGDGDEPAYPFADEDGAERPAGEVCHARGAVGTCLPAGSCNGVVTPGLCGGPDDVQCCTEEAEGCDPLARPLPNAGLTEKPGVGGCPSGMVPVADFCVDQYEASLEVVREDGSTEPWSPFWNPAGERVRAVSLEGAIPQSTITGKQAAMACAEAGKRLCTDSEWLRACQGPEGTTYPYGNEREPGVCNDSRYAHPAIEYYGTSDPWIWGRLGNACLNQLAETVDHSGENTGCVTAEGAYDMMGNLHEWTSNPEGTFRGGYYMDTSINGNGCRYTTRAHPTGYSDYSTGFRCCALPEDRNESYSASTVLQQRNPRW